MSRQGEFRNKVSTVPVGDKYEEYEKPNGDIIKRGDIVVFEDPDSLDQVVFIGFVEHIGDMDRGGVELFTTQPIGRIPIDKRYVGIRGEYIDTTDSMGLDSQIEQFISKAGLNSSTTDPVTEANVKSATFEWGTDGGMEVEYEK